MFRGLFKLRGPLTRPDELVLGVIGAVVIVSLWSFTVQAGLVKPQLLPPPTSVVRALPELHFQDALIRNALFSIKLNVSGYLEAIALALPLGFIIGLNPLCRGMFMTYITALRALPLTGVIGLFIVAFGLTTQMKIHFLALGIFVYLLPVVVQRINEVQQVHLDTVKTLGATPWQTVRTVFIPDVLSRVYYDILVMVAISWTYIIIAEVMNKGEGGIGALVDTCFRQSRPDKAYAALALIVTIVFVQDKLGRLAGRWMFPFRKAA